MARLETQINQIYYVPETGKEVSLVLTDEVLNNSSHLFVIAGITNIQKKTEETELKKISEIILTIFRDNKKLTGENLFESSLAHINQSLADLAHGGKKSWIGKFSALIALKSSDSIYVTSSGAVSSMLYRSKEFVEVLGSEKPGEHPLKTFTNFTSGKLKADDILLLTTSNLTSYIALENLNKLLSEDSPERVVEQVSKILKETSNQKEGFASFFVALSKPAAVTAAKPAVAPVSDVKPAAKPAGAPKIKRYNEASPTVAGVPSAPVMEEIYAPLPQQMKKSVTVASNTDSEKKLFDRIPKINLPKFKFNFRKPGFWDHLSVWGKFCLVMFLLAAILLGANIIKYSLNKRSKDAQTTLSAQMAKIDQEMGDAESALIYRNQDQAIKILSDIKADLETLKKLDGNAYNQYQQKLTDLTNRINKITVVNSPQVLTTLKHDATNMVRAGKGFVFANSDSSAITTFQTGSDDQQPKDLFLLNKIGAITGLVHIPGVGHVVTTNSEMYLVNTTQNQFDLLHVYPKTEMSGLKYLAKPDRVYTLDKLNNKVLRIPFSTTVQNSAESALKELVDLTQIVDLGVDTDIYLLSNTTLNRYTNGNLNTNFKLVQPTDQITSANKLFVAANIYILESAKKRILVYNKTGTLVTQMIFPNTNDIRDFYVDESSRNIYLLDKNQLLSITF